MKTHKASSKVFKKKKNGELSYKLSNGNFTYDKMKYSEVNIEEALEFVDLVFDNDLDKVYFLRQYIKNYEENFKTNKAVMVKRFVK